MTNIATTGKGKSSSNSSIEQSLSASSSSSSSSTSSGGSGGNKEPTTKSMSSENVPSEATLGRQLECANDEIRLLRNKIARLEDDLLTATQVFYALDILIGEREGK